MDLHDEAIITTDLLLGAVLAPLNICSPWAVSRKTQIQSATFLISRPRETPKYCIKPHRFSMPRKPLWLKDSPFYFVKIYCKLPLISCTPRVRAPTGPSHKTESHAGTFTPNFGTWIYSRFFKIKMENLWAPGVPVVSILPPIRCDILQCHGGGFEGKWHLGFEFSVRSLRDCKFLG